MRSAIGVLENTVWGHYPGTRFGDTTLDTMDPPEIAHKLQLATYCQSAGKKDDGSLKQTPSVV